MKGMIVENKFGLGDAVYVRTDPEQRMRLVTGICLRPGPNSVPVLIYYAQLDTSESSFYDFELSSEKDLVKAAEA